MSKTASTRTTVEQQPIRIPDFSVKELLSAIPAHCFERSALWSSMYIIGDGLAITAIYRIANAISSFITPSTIPNPYLNFFARFALWSLYTFWTGLFATGLWVVAHECGHQAFSTSKFINNAVGWVLHSAVGVPYHSWRISHGLHHAKTGHLTEDQVFVPKTRSQLGLPPLNPEKEELGGASISNDVKAELWEALGDSPIGAVLGFFSFLIFGWPLYIGMNASGQARYPANTNHFTPSSVIYRPNQYWQIIWSDVGILIWAGAIIASTFIYGFKNVFVLYFVPYLWVNHWLVLITFLQHTDPTLPHYRQNEFTFPRGALATLDRSLLGDLGPAMAWIGAVATHGISETHVAHHVASKIPHYNAWEATDALRAHMEKAGIKLVGRPGGWAEMYRVFRSCKFVEDEGDIVFFKDANGLAHSRPVYTDSSPSDSGVEVDKDA